MSELTVHPIPLEQTRRLRQEVLRPHQSVEELATHEPPGAVAFGAFADEEPIAVGLVGADGEPGFEAVSAQFEAPKIGPHHRMELRMDPTSTRFRGNA